MVIIDFSDAAVEPRQQGGHSVIPVSAWDARLEIRETAGHSQSQRTSSPGPTRIRSSHCSQFPDIGNHLQRMANKEQFAGNGVLFGPEVESTKKFASPHEPLPPRFRLLTSSMHSHTLREYIDIGADQKSMGITRCMTKHLELCPLPETESPEISVLRLCYRARTKPSLPFL